MEIRVSFWADHFWADHFWQIVALCPLFALSLSESVLLMGCRPLVEVGHSLRMRLWVAILLH